MTTVLMQPWGELLMSSGVLTARSAYGEFKLPADVYVRAKRLDRRFPGNYSKDGGYIGAWCRHQWSKSER